MADSAVAPPGGQDIQQPLMTTILQHVEHGEARDIGFIMESRSIAEQLQSIAWDLIPQVCDFLTIEILNDRPAVIDTAETVLTQLALKAKPKEVLLVLLEQADTFNDDVKFKTLLLAIQTCLLQLPAKRGHSIAIAVETLYAHIERLSVPEHHRLEGKERTLLENDSEIIRVNDVSRAMIDFLKPLAEKISYREGPLGQKVKDVSEQKELVHCIVKLLNNPLANMDTLYNGEVVKSESRLNAERLMSVLTLVQPDYIRLLAQLHEENFQIDENKKMHAQKKNEKILMGDIPDDDDYDVQEKYPERGLAVLAYLGFGEELGLERTPRVYTAQFVFESVLPSVSFLLSSSGPFLIEKGVHLLHATLSRIVDSSISSDILEWKEVSCAAGHLIQVVTQSQNKDICAAAVKILPLWMSKFDVCGRHKSLYFILMKEHHSGLVGYATQMLKNEVDRALKMNPPNKFFTGSHLEKLLDLVFVLPQGSQTDLLEQSDRIMAALNLLRYLVIRDKPTQNATGIWTCMPRVEKNFCEPLREGINLSRAHYDLELNKAKEGTSDVFNKKAKDNRNKKSKWSCAEMSVSVDGQSIPELTPEQERQVAHMALHTFDMMQSVLVRVEDLVSQQKADSIDKSALS